MKHTGSGGLGAQTYREPMPHERWHQTPKWHWRYWFGYRMRKATNGDYPLHNEPAWYIYRTFGTHARKVLEEMANVGTEQSTQNRHGRPGRSY